MPFATSDGCKIYYRLEGDQTKPLLVLVHSLGAEHGMWAPQMAALLRYFRVLRVDLRGHGASDTTPGDYTIAQLAGDVLNVAGDECFAYCGLSLGGMIGQWLGANAADRVERLVLANTSPRVADPAIFDSRRAVVLERGMSAVAEAVMQRSFLAKTLVSFNPMVETIRTFLLANNPIGYAGCCAAVRDMDQIPLLPRIKCSVLVIAGTNDVSTPWEGHGDVLANNIPAAQSRKLFAAHLSNIEQPSSFTSALLEFLLPTPAVDTLEAGFAVRRSVLGNVHVDKATAGVTDLNREFQDLITRYAWGSIWTRPGLDPHMRRLLVLAITAARGNWEEFRLHVRTGFAGQLESADLKEVLLQTAIYAGVPAANTGFQIAQEENDQV